MKVKIEPEKPPISDKEKTRIMRRAYAFSRTRIGLPCRAMKEELEAVEATQACIEKLTALVKAHKRCGRRKGMNDSYHCSICEDAGLALKVIELMAGFYVHEIPMTPEQFTEFWKL